MCLSSPPALTDPNAAAAQQAVLQQQINALAYSPFGDSPLFRNPLSDPKKKEEVGPASFAVQANKIYLFFNGDQIIIFILNVNRHFVNPSFAAIEADQSDGSEGSDHAHPLQAHPAARHQSPAQGADLVGGFQVPAV